MDNKSRSVRKSGELSGVRHAAYFLGWVCCSGWLLGLVADACSAKCIGVSAVVGEVRASCLMRGAHDLTSRFCDSNPALNSRLWGTTPGWAAIC